MNTNPRLTVSVLKRANKALKKKLNKESRKATLLTALLKKNKDLRGELDYQRARALSIPSEYDGFDK